MISVVATVQCDTCGFAIQVPGKQMDKEVEGMAYWTEFAFLIVLPKLWRKDSSPDEIECPYCKQKEQKKTIH